MFCDVTAPLPDDVLKLGSLLGPSKDIGPAMIAKNLTQNGKVLPYRSEYRPLIPDDLLHKDG